MAGEALALKPKLADNIALRQRPFMFVRRAKRDQRITKASVFLTTMACVYRPAGISRRSMQTDFLNKSTVFLANLKRPRGNQRGCRGGDASLRCSYSNTSFGSIKTNLQVNTIKNLIATSSIQF
jgi:hypothetical protein